MQSVHLCFLKVPLSFITLCIAPMPSILHQDEAKPAPTHESYESPCLVLWAHWVYPLLRIPVLKRCVERIMPHLLLILLVSVVLLTLIIDMLVSIPVFPRLLLLSSLPFIHLLHIPLKLTKRIIAIRASLVGTAATSTEKLLRLPLKLLRAALLAAICVECVLVAPSVPVGCFAVEFSTLTATVPIVKFLLSIRVIPRTLMISETIEVPIGLVLSLLLTL